MRVAGRMRAGRAVTPVWPDREISDGRCAKTVFQKTTRESRAKRLIRAAALGNKSSADGKSTEAWAWPTTARKAWVSRRREVQVSYRSSGPPPESATGRRAPQYGGKPIALYAA